MNKNHEGYADYTACEAVRRADRDRKQLQIVAFNPLLQGRQAVDRSLRLTYRLEEARGFAEARNTVCR